jgi:hypothetical protein
MILPDNYTDNWGVLLKQQARGLETAFANTRECCQRGSNREIL